MIFFQSKSNPYLNDPDVALMMAFKEGDITAFEALMERNYKRVFAFIVRMGLNQSQAEDLTQEIFIKLYQMASSYQPRSKISTLLFQMARNASLNELRKKPQASLDEYPEESWTQEQANPQSQLEKEERIQLVQKALDQLPEAQRTAVLLHRYENMSYEEIAIAMKTSPKAIKSLLNRAKENLRILLKAHF